MDRHLSRPTGSTRALYTLRVRLYTGGVRRRLVLGLVAALLGVSALQPTARAQEPAERPPFADWLAGVRQEALSRGIRTDIIEQALGNIPEPLPVVLERDRSQAEIVLPLETYVSRRLTRKVITSGRQMYGQHKELLDAIEAEFGVPGRIIVAIWGVESNYGRFSGVRPTVAALATLAWDPRRATFFRGELFNALEILNRGDIELANMKGAWAGAMGQPQFMPSSYLQYATDRDGDGRRDIWSSSPDVFASIANYLKGHGWTADQRWGREVSISASVADKITTTVARREGTCRATRDMTVSMPVDDWATLGVRALDGGPLPKSDIQASLVSGSTRQFLVYGNYDALLSYNCAHAYALSVAMLGDMVAGSSPIAGATSRPSSSPARATRPARPARRGARKPAAGKHVSGSMRPVRQSAATRRPRATSASRRTAVSRRATRLRPARRSGAASSGRNRAATAVRPSAPALAAPPTPADSTPAPSPAPVPGRLAPGPVVRVSDRR